MMGSQASGFLGSEEPHHTGFLCPCLRPPPMSLGPKVARTHVCLARSTPPCSRGFKHTIVQPPWQCGEHTITAVTLPPHCTHEQRKGSCWAPCSHPPRKGAETPKWGVLKEGVVGRGYLPAAGPREPAPSHSSKGEIGICFMLPVISEASE